MKLVQGQREPEHYVDAKKMAEILGVSLSTFYVMRREYDIPSCLWLRRTRRYVPSTVIAHLNRVEVRRTNTEEAA